MQLILTPPPKVMVILKEISFNCGSPGWYSVYGLYKLCSMACIVCIIPGVSSWEICPSMRQISLRERVEIA